MGSDGKSGSGRLGLDLLICVYRNSSENRALEMHIKSGV